ncbi:fumarylacetoacetate hydrolase family protein [Nocardioides sp. KIGAM211]|uniref:Fumarylacetoacetate hydrolase family protein n=1 Tax=Nocardioides luti TaxID=2761101 RepID=A0A7X0RD45_9ACTN|nr:2-keto-4-pentenoate hydratase [Nocardioides luti]MBB6626035.1 fumarylacetoacetate hydrolase family protein [Nocardioides luti]
MLSDDVRREVAAALAAAERDRRPIPPLRETWPEIDVVDAYEVQLLNIRRRLATGATVHGHKVGLSSRAMQEMMGVDEPDYGHLLSDMAVSEDRPVSAGRYCYPRVEVEVGFVLGADLPGEGCTEDDVLAATEAVAPAIELIDSRIRDWDIRIGDTIADNASSAGYVLGPDRVKPADLDLRSIEARLTRNGEQVAEGRSDAVLGNPVTAVAWLARKVATFGVTLEAGNVILPGSVHRAIDVRPGDDFEAVLDGLGTVRLSFTD